MPDGSEHLWRIIWQFSYGHLLAPLGRSWVGRAIAKGIRPILEEVYGKVVEILGEKAASRFPSKDGLITGFAAAVLLE